MRPLPRSALAVFLLFACLLPGVRGQTTPARNVELDVRFSTAESKFVLYFDVGSGIGNDYAIESLAASPKVQHLVFPINQGTLRAMRIDPSKCEGTVVISDLKIVTPRDGTSLKLDISHVQRGNQIARQTLLPVSGYLEITTEPGAHDPQCYLTLDESLPCGPPPGPAWLNEARVYVSAGLWWGWIG